MSHGNMKRGTPGFGEEALQSLPGKVGSQVCNLVIFLILVPCDSYLISELWLKDVQDCLTALDFVIKEGLIDASKVAVVGISHGGFLATHLIGQVSILTEFRTMAGMVDEFAAPILVVPGIIFIWLLFFSAGSR